MSPQESKVASAGTRFLLTIIWRELELPSKWELNWTWDNHSSIDPVFVGCQPELHIASSCSCLFR